MHRSTPLRRLLLAASLVALACQLAGCGSTADGGPTYTVTGSLSTETSVNTTDLAGRPASPAHIHIVSPAPGTTVQGGMMHVVVGIDGATITTQVTRNISPTTGHVHLYVDQVLIYMAYSLQQDVPVHAGTFQLQAEFVAADHAPFNPRVITSQIVTVAG